MRWINRAEAFVSGTPFERTARWWWQHAHAAGRPRARQSLRYDREARRIMRRVLEPSSNCLDIGANRGSFLEEMIDLAPQGTHLAFEPLPELARRLERRFPTCAVNQVALSDRSGEREFCKVADSLGLSGFRTMGNIPPDARIERIAVRAARLDDILPRDLRIHFIKLDVEGAQYEVIRGGVATISRDLPYIILEHGALAFDSYGTTSEMIYDLITHECRLQLSLMADWLAGRPALTREQFAGHVGHHATSHFCFLAHRPAG